MTSRSYANQKHHHITNLKTIKMSINWPQRPLLHLKITSTLPILIFLFMLSTESCHRCSIIIFLTLPNRQASLDSVPRTPCFELSFPSIPIFSMTFHSHSPFRAQKRSEVAGSIWHARCCGRQVKSTSTWQVGHLERGQLFSYTTRYSGTPSV